MAAHTHTPTGAGLALGLLLSGCSSTDNPEATPREGEPVISSESPPAPEYRDGQYTARGIYGSLPSHQDVTLTLADGVISGATITTPAENEISLGYQRRFAAALPAAIVGRNIDGLNVDRLAGSSGCSEGFHNALQKIKQQAAV